MTLGTQDPEMTLNMLTVMVLIFMFYLFSWWSLMSENPLQFNIVAKFDKVVNLSMYISV